MLSELLASSLVSSMVHGPPVAAAMSDRNDAREEDETTSMPEFELLVNRYESKNLNEESWKRELKKRASSRNSWMAS